MIYLILVRHTESVWNAKGLWTGLTDISLDEKGKEQARQVGESIKKLNIKIGLAYTSTLKRTKATLAEIKNVLGLGLDVPTFENKALNERDYGIYTGKNKWDIQKEVGEEKFKQIRRGWNYPIPKGESLKDVYKRVVPYFKNEILPKLKEGQNVLIVAHGNSLRALTKYLENISNEEITKLEIATGEIEVFEITSNGNVLSKRVVK